MELKDNELATQKKTAAKKKEDQACLTIKFGNERAAREAFLKIAAGVFS